MGWPGGECMPLHCAHVGRNKKRVLNHDDEISLATKKNKGKLYYYYTVHIAAHPAV